MQAAFGLMLHSGGGVPQDTDQGLVWLYLASEAGNEKAEEYYDRMILELSDQSIERIKLIADDWRSRVAPMPVTMIDWLE